MQKMLSTKKKFWSTVRSHQSDKDKIFQKGYFHRRGKIITEDTESAEILNELLSNAVKNLKVADSALQIHWLIKFLIVLSFIIFIHSCTNKQKYKKYNTLLYVNRYTILKKTYILKNQALKKKYPAGAYLFKVNKGNVISEINVLNVNRSMFAE